MDLYAHFPKYPEKDYPVTMGPTFKQNYNETLDSGTIRLDHVLEKLKVKPFDDVIIYSGTLRKKSSRYEVIQGANFRDAVTGDFYAHFLVGDISRQRTSAPKSTKIYGYTISLMSETKGLEKIPLPNTSITQPRNGNYISIGEFMVKMLQMHCPSVKMIRNDQNPDNESAIWINDDKYVINLADPCWEGIVDLECPEHTFNTPTLRNVLDFALSAKDRIVVVHDWVIRCINITERKNSLGDLEDDPQAMPGTWMMSEADYCDRLRTEYSDGLPSKTTTHYTEKLGFRNSDAAIMTLQNMRIEFSHPIYKIKKMYLCYYKNILYNAQAGEGPEYVLVKRDITPLVLLNEYRDLLSENWVDVNFMANNQPPTTMDEMAQYRMCTIGYDIGSRFIGGWGQTYSFQSGFFRGERSYLENLVTFLASVYYFDDATNAAFKGQVTKALAQSDTGSEMATYCEQEVERIAYTGLSQVYPPVSDAEVKDTIDEMERQYGVTGKLYLPNSYTLRLKSIFFEVEYEGFVDAAVISSKDYHDGTIHSIDAQSQSLALTESDGVAKKEKVNRLGNATLTVPMRHYSMDDIKNLGDYDDEDNIVYMSSITIYPDCIAATYWLCKDYVLKNYYTSVISKLRPFPMASYNESVLRKENRMIEMLFSPDESYSDDKDHRFPFKFYKMEDSVWDVSSDLDVEKYIISFFNMSEWDAKKKEFINAGRVNFSTVSQGSSIISGDHHLVDTQCFNFGYSMCANVEMDYNYKTKAYISRYRPNFFTAIANRITAFFSALNKAEDFVDLVTGALQSYYKKDANSVLAVENLMFCAISIDSSYLQEKFMDANSTTNLNDVNAIMDDYLLKYPLEDSSIINHDGNFALVSKIPWKDNKEKISMTMQIEPVSETDDIQFSEYFLLMSDFYSQLPKTKEDISYQTENALFVLSASDFSAVPPDGEDPYCQPMIVMYLKSEYANTEFDQSFNSDNAPVLTWDYGVMKSNGSPSQASSGVYGLVLHDRIKIRINRIKRDATNISNNTIDVECQLSYWDGGTYNSATKKWEYGTETSTTYNATLPYDASLGHDLHAPYGWRGFGITATAYVCVSADIAYERSGSELTQKVFRHDGNISPALPISQYSIYDQYGITVGNPVITGFNDTLKTIKRTYYVFVCGKMDKDTKYESFSVVPNDYIDITNSVSIAMGSDQNWVPCLSMYYDFITPVQSKQTVSMRVYYYDNEDGLYHFAFGQNKLLNVGDHEISTVAYISLMGNRERTVYKQNGDAYGRIANCVSDTAQDQPIPYGNPVAIKVN